MLARLGHDPVGLMSVLRVQIAMPLQYLFRREQLFTISGAVRRDLRGSRAVDPRLTEMVFDLFPARTGGTKGPKR
jgi:hypothetical protein